MRAILFDFNGILVDDEPVHLELTQRVLSDEGVELTEAQYVDLCLGRNDRAALAAALEASKGSGDPALVERLVARKTAYYHVRMRTDGFRFFDGARELVEAASDSGVMLGVVTGALQAEVESALEQWGLASRFKAVVAAEDVEHSKPHPEGFLLGLRQLNTLPPLPTRLLHPHEVVAIEDTPAGLAAARAAGLTTVGVAHTFDPEQLDADRVFASLVDVGLDALHAL